MLGWKRLCVMGVFCISILGCSDSNNKGESDVDSSSFDLVAVGGPFVGAGVAYGIRDNGESVSGENFVDDAGETIVFHQDAIVKSFDNKIYVLERSAQSVATVFDMQGDSNELIANYSLAEEDPDGDVDINGNTDYGTNPYDMVFVNDEKAFIGFYNSNYILEINPLTGDRIRSIDVGFVRTLAGLTEIDETGKPGIIDLEIIDERLYILAQRLDTFFTALEPAIVVYDINTETFVDLDETTETIDGINLSGKNPNGMVYSKSLSSIVVSYSGKVNYLEDYSAIESTDEGTTGIELVDIDSGIAEGILVSGALIGGAGGGYSMSELKLLEDNKVIVNVSFFDFTNNYVIIDLNNATTGELLLSENSGAFGSYEVYKDKLFILDRDFTSPGIRIFDLKSNAESLDFIETEIPLQSIIVID